MKETQETQFRSLGREDPLEEEMATHSNTLAWRIPWREESGRLQSMGSQRVGHDWAISHHSNTMNNYMAVRTGHETMDGFQIGKGVHQGCILSPWLFNLYAEYVKQNARLDEAQSGIKIAGKNISTLRYEDDTTLMTESKEELNSLLMKVKEESEKACLKLNWKN